MTVDVYDNQNKKVDSMDLPDNVFSVPWNPELVHQVAISLDANKRRPWAHTKDRGEVSGGGKKPWKQKGTGRARAGSTRSPIWKGGGVAFGPSKERNYEKKINKKMKKQALFSALSRKLKDGEVKIIDSFVLTAPKTKECAVILKNLTGGAVMSKSKKPVSTLIVAAKENKEIKRAGRNINKNSVIYSETLGLAPCLASNFIFFEKNAVAQFIAHYK